MIDISNRKVHIRWSCTGSHHLPLSPYRGDSGANDFHEGDVGDLGEFGVDNPRAAHKVDVEEYVQPSSQSSKAVSIERLHGELEKIHDVRTEMVAIFIEESMSLTCA